MMQPTIQQRESHPENENGQQHDNNNNNNSSNNLRYRDGRRVSPRHKESDRMIRNDEDYYHSNRRDHNPQGFPQYESSSYLASFCRWCCTFQHFCYVVQLVNCCLVVGLIYFVVNEYPKLQALDRLDELQKQLEQNHADIESLQEEVHTKQEGQLNDIEESLKQEQRNNFLSFAGIFTLLTCLISMFHMTTHVHKLCQPKIQRKIIAILWMSPIYSVTSFLSLIFPPIEGWMAIVKDFYESYCIFVFLSFLIAVLGEGSRDKAVEVLAKHADHLDQPTRCLGCFYEPPPSASDHAKANAVMTQCQIYCLQFTIIRPITTIIRVFGLNRNKDQQMEDEQDGSNNDEFSDYSTEKNVDVDSSNNNEIYYPTNTTESLPIGTEIGDEPLTESSYPQPNNDTETTTSTNYENDRNSGNGGVRKLLHFNSLRRKQRDRSLQLEPSEEKEEETPPTIGNSLNNKDERNDPFAEFPTVAPISSGNEFPTPLGEDFLSPTFIEETGMPTEDGNFPPTFGSYGSGTQGPTFASNDTIAFDYGNSTGEFGGMFDANMTGNFSPTFVPTLSPSFTNDTSFTSNELVDQTKAYFRSPGFALAMVVNVSIFFAFSGLLKLYHAVREDLLWCRPFPKFLTIKAVVFLTFWQGLAILIYLILTGAEDASSQAHRYQNMLICVEMLLVAISQWCVFPAVEWEPDYEPRNMQTPGLGIKDFVSDVGQIVKNRKSRKGRRRKKRGGTPNSSKSGLYHMPGFASVVSSQFDGFGGPNRGTRADSSDFGENSSLDQSYDSSSTFERENGVDSSSEIIENENDIGAYDLPSSVLQGNRDRILSDDTGGYSIEDEGSDRDMELL